MSGKKVIKSTRELKISMSERTALKTTVACLVAVMMTVAFTAAPAAAAIDSDDGVGITDDTDGTVDGVTDDSSAAGGDGDVRVQITDTNSPVQTGETLVVTAEISTKTGGEVWLLIDGERIERKGFAPSQTGEYNFTWETSATDLGDHNATLASGTDSDSETVTVEFGTDPPEETCTNVPERANENVPYEELPSQDDLPEDAPTPVPPFITPRGVANLIIGVAPNQCEVVDPDDPAVDPSNPPDDPAYDVIVFRNDPYKDGRVVRVYYRVTLDDEDDGPEVYGFAGGLVYSGGAGTSPSATYDDGSGKQYSTDPMVRGDDSTADGEADVGAPFGSVGATVDCSGGECQPGTSGIPTAAEYPAVPAPVWDGED